MGASVAIRVGGPNSGHTVIGPDGQPIIFRQLPTASILPNVVCVIPSGAYVQPDLLLDEIRIAGLNPERLLIDPNAVIITDKELAAERSSGLGSSIGSTQSGTGAAVLARIRRSSEVRFARDVDSVRPYVQPATAFLRDRLERNERVLIEGTQGFGLSLLHTPDYPFATSRDTTAAGFVAEAGLSPLDIDDVVMVIRTFPIRVPGNSGPLPNETSWAEITKDSNSSIAVSEFTSVTKKERRVAKFDSEIVRGAIIYNQPTRIILNHVDYIDAGCRQIGSLTPKAVLFVNSTEKVIGKTIDYVGFNSSDINLFTKLRRQNM
jgi:adenylosuccinate synthase